MVSMTDYVYAAAYATLKARGIKPQHLARAAAAVMARAERLGVTVAQSINAFKAA